MGRTEPEERSLVSVYDRCEVIGQRETRRSGYLVSSSKLPTRCTAVVSAVAKMTGRKGKVDKDLL